jgi:hypothetical protein
MNALANDLSRLGRASRAWLGLNHQHFINGQFVQGSHGQTLAVI